MRCRTTLKRHPNTELLRSHSGAHTPTRRADLSLSDTKESAVDRPMNWSSAGHCLRSRPLTLFSADGSRPLLDAPKESLENHLGRVPTSKDICVRDPRRAPTSPIDSGNRFAHSKPQWLWKRLGSKLMRKLEARVGIEPTHKGFADLSLTTWVPRLGRAALNTIVKVDPNPP
jgi:hypothetical protein